MTLLQEVNKNICDLDSLVENIEIPSEKALSFVDQRLVETAEAVLGKVFAQVGASQPIDQRLANIVMGLFALGNSDIGPQIQQKLGALGKQGTPLKVALQLAGDDEDVNSALADFGSRYAQSNPQGQPFQLRSMLLGSNVLKDTQRETVKKVLQKAMTQYRAALAKEGQQKEQPQKQAGTTPDASAQMKPQTKVAQAGMTNMGATTPIGSVA